MRVNPQIRKIKSRLFGMFLLAGTAFSLANTNVETVEVKEVIASQGTIDFEKGCKKSH